MKYLPCLPCSFLSSDLRDRSWTRASELDPLLQVPMVRHDKFCRSNMATHIHPRNPRFHPNVYVCTHFENILSVSPFLYVPHRNSSASRQSSSRLFQCGTKTWAWALALLNTISSAYGERRLRVVCVRIISSGSSNWDYRTRNLILFHVWRSSITVQW